MKIPGPDHPITVEPAKARVVVRAGEKIIVDTTSALALKEASYPVVYYVPAADADESVLISTDTHTTCPYKGQASYYTIRTDEGDLTDAVWYYPEPYDAVASIAGHLAFYPDKVEIVAIEEG